MKNTGIAALVVLVVGLTLSLNCMKNQAPLNPDEASGPASGSTDAADEFALTASDPDNDSVRFVIDWGTGYYDTTEYFASEAVLTVSHTWETPGTFEVRFLAQDEKGLASNWSPVHVVVITGEVDHGPDRPPTPSGPTVGNRRTPYVFADSSADPDGDSISYRFRAAERIIGDWSSNLPQWKAATFQTSFYNRGTFDVECQARDIHGHTSVWSPSLRITIY